MKFSGLKKKGCVLSNAASYVQDKTEVGNISSDMEFRLLLENYYAVSDKTWKF